MSRRDDFLVSVGFADAPRSDKARAQLQQFAVDLDAAWRYWEILIVTDAAETADLDPLLAELPNLRLLRTRGLSNLYRRRAIAGAEAIGDLVVLSAIEELPHLDLMAMLSESADTDTVIVARRDGRNLFLDGVLSILGRSSGFRVQARDMQTVVLPRTFLNRLLSRPDRNLALRFLPRDSAMPVRYHQPTNELGLSRTAGLGRRMGILQKLLVYSAPSVLGWVSLLSVLVALSGLAFAIYAVCVWLLLETVQPGWFTTSLAISLTAAFLGVAIFGVAAGILKVIDLMTPDALDDVTDERGHADLFDRVVHDLNIETGPEDGQAR